MRVGFVFRNPSMSRTVEAVFLARGFVVADSPEVLVVMGGDGTLLRAERSFPGVPKALLKDSSVGNLYMEHTAEELAAALKEKRYSIEERDCLEALIHGNTFRAANDVIIRNKRLTQAMRFRVTIDGHDVGGELIGDGLVVSTPMGSTAYFHSITRKSFAKGFGIAFNNIHNKADFPFVLTDSPDIVISIMRGPADIGVDNSEHLDNLTEGDIIHISKSLTPMRVVKIRL